MSDSPLPPEAAASLREWLGDEWSAEPLLGDASVRAYFRISRPDGSTFMLSYYPESVRAQMRRVLEAYEALAGHGRVPEIHHHSEAAMLQQDVGDRTLYDVLHADRTTGIELYRQAIDLLVLFQESGACSVNPAFTAEFFLGELEMTREFFLEKLIGTATQAVESCKPLLESLCQKVASHSYALCHRDYHGQNLHVFNGRLFVIDYQDLRMGPDTYDLASLLRDRGVARILGQETELGLVDYYARRTNAAEGLRRRYFEVLLQRSIKILGTFARQPIERGRLHYLDFIPATLESVHRCLGELPEYAALADVFPAQFDPAAAKERIRHASTQDHAPSR